jgi:hypothetical protein
MAVSDARRLQVYEQARAQRGDEPAEALMELVPEFTYRVYVKSRPGIGERVRAAGAGRRA